LAFLRSLSRTPLGRCLFIYLHTPSLTIVPNYIVPTTATSTDRTTVILPSACPSTDHNCCSHSRDLVTSKETSEEWIPITCGLRRLLMRSHPPTKYLDIFPRSLRQYESPSISVIPYTGILFSRKPGTKAPRYSLGWM
jgi:hypothetical protein